MTELLYSPKIKPEHLARKAIVYLRQSSEKQLRQNKESQRLQLDLSIITMMSGYCSWAIFPIWAKDCQEALEPHVHLRQASGGIARFTAEDSAAFVDRCPV